MSNVLERIVEKKHYSFIDGKGISWQEAVRLSALPLVEEGSVKNTAPTSLWSITLPCLTQRKTPLVHIGLQ